MATYTKLLLSGSTNGKQIKISATSNGGASTLHTAVSGTASLDEVFLYAVNNTSSAVKLTLLWGGTTEPDNAITLLIAPNVGRTLVADGILLQNSLVISAYAATASAINIDGFVNRIA